MSDFEVLGSDFLLDASDVSLSHVELILEFVHPLFILGLDLSLLGAETLETFLVFFNLLGLAVINISLTRNLLVALDDFFLSVLILTSHLTQVLLCLG